MLTPGEIMMLGFILGCTAAATVSMGWDWFFEIEEKPKQPSRPEGNLPCAWLNRPKRTNATPATRFQFGPSKRIGLDTRYGVFDFDSQEVITVDCVDKAKQCCDELNFLMKIYENLTLIHDDRDKEINEFIEMLNPSVKVRQTELTDLRLYKTFVHGHESSVRELAAIRKLQGEEI